MARHEGGETAWGYEGDRSPETPSRIVNDGRVILVPCAPGGILEADGTSFELMTLGRENPFLARFHGWMPVLPGEATPGGTIDPAAALPGDLRHFAYRGSRTSPPCEEGVAWFVLRTPVQVAADQVARLVAITGRNARGTQPLNDRRVLEC
jgi:carbonic anhydrase